MRAPQMFVQSGAPSGPAIALAAFLIPIGVAVGLFTEFVLRVNDDIPYEQLRAINPGRWQPIARALKGVGYRGDVVIESFTTDVKVIARAAAIWRRIEPTRNEIAVKGLKFLRANLA